MEEVFIRLALTADEFRYIVKLVSTRPIEEALPFYVKLGEQERAQRAPPPLAAVTPLNPAGKEQP